MHIHNYYGLGSIIEVTVIVAEGDGVRCELAGIRYEYNVLGTRGPRKMTALIPGTDAHGQNYIFRPESSNDGILDRSASVSCSCCAASLMKISAFMRLCLSCIGPVYCSAASCTCATALFRLAVLTLDERATD